MAVIGIFACNIAIAAPLPQLKNSNTPIKKTIKISSGTGFYVSPHHIVTNEHVVRSCKSIRIRGSIIPTEVALIAKDTEKDLAILSTDVTPNSIATLRGNNDIQKGEDVTVVGYPLKHAVTGIYDVQQAKILNTLGTFNNRERVEFTDSVHQGNSGGPLLDSNGNVIGVVVGKVTYFRNVIDVKSSSAKIPPGTVRTIAQPVKVSSIAITLGSLYNFLTEHGVSPKFKVSDTRTTPQAVDHNARDYVVNVHCILGSQAI